MSLPLPVADAAERTVASVCPYCGVGCGLLLTVRDERIVKVAGLAAERHGGAAQLCLKGRLGLDFVHHGDRLTAPLVRREWVREELPGGGHGPWHWAGAAPRGAATPAAVPRAEAAYGTPDAWRAPFREATWEEALSLAAQELHRARHAHGPQGVAALASGKCTTEENYALMRLLRGALGSNAIDHCARLCHAPSVAAMGRALGAGVATGSIADIDHADVLLVAGANTTETHPVIGTRMLRAVRGGTRLIVVDVRRTELAGRATVFLQPRPGTDTVLYGAMLRHVAERALLAAGFIRARTIGFDAALEAASLHTLDEAAAITGVAAAAIAAAAELYASGPATTTLWAMGLTQQRRGTEVVTSLVNLALACGMVGRRGAALLPLRGQNNVQGACDMGALPDVFPGYQKVADPAVRARFAAAWGVPADRLTAEPGLRATAMAAPGSPVRALYVLGENPALSDASVEHTEAWLRGLDFLVSHDLFLTETGRLADVVLPGAAFAEKEGTYVNTERRIQLAEPALAAPGAVRPELDVLVELTERLGVPVHARTPAATLDEIARVTPDWALVSYARLRDEGSLQHPVTAASPDGTAVLHGESFPTPTGRATFVPVSNVPAPRAPGFDFTVVTGRSRFHWHTGTMTRRSAALVEKEPAAACELHPDDAVRLGLAAGDRVRVETAHGAIELVAEASERVAPGQVFVPMHFREAAANRLTGLALDAVTGTPSLKGEPARVTRAGAA